MTRVSVIQATRNLVDGIAEGNLIRDAYRLLRERYTLADISSMTLDQLIEAVMAEVSRMRAAKDNA